MADKKVITFVMPLVLVEKLDDLRVMRRPISSRSKVIIEAIEMFLKNQQ